jgi:hypothetical protein
VSDISEHPDQIYHVSLTKRSGEVQDIWVTAKDWDEAKDKLKRGDVSYTPPKGYPLDA